ncbi:MAG: single-stranded DNA-binding protein [Acidobacteriota bacterium]|nr:single-stranded DNA-binding protein [Acidobacteriota bacterium]
MEESQMSNVGVNKVILIGNAGQDAEVRATSSGKTVANFSLAINRPFREGNGDRQKVEWVHCVAWNKQAEIAGKMITKGKQVFVEGRLQTRQFEDRQGTTRTVTEVVVTSLRVLGRAANGSPNGGGQRTPASSTQHAADDEVPF